MPIINSDHDPLVAVRPPEFWPSPIAFAVMDAADGVVLADTLQYSRQSFQNRARLRTPQDWQWISVPLKGGQHGRPICEVMIRNRQPWSGKHWRALHYNYRRSPYFDFYEPRIKPLFGTHWETLGELTCRTVELMAELLGLSTPIERASQLDGGPRSVPDILEACEASRLLTGEDTSAADRESADEVQVLMLSTLRYRQNFDGFVPGMSALDLLFNYGPESLAVIRRAVSMVPTSAKETVK